MQSLYHLCLGVFNGLVSAQKSLHCEILSFRSSGKVLVPYSKRREKEAEEAIRCQPVQFGSDWILEVNSQVRLITVNCFGSQSELQIM